MKTSHPILLAALLSASTLPACGGDENSAQPDAGDPDAEVEDMPDASDPDAEPTPFVDPEPIAVRLSATGADGFFAVAFDQAGDFYAAGYTAATATDRAMVVAKFTSAGALDTSFGSAGVAMVNVAVGGGAAETARSIAVQTTGKIVVGGVIEHDVLATAPAASDRDMAVFRLDSNGSLDATFDGDGIRVLDLGTGFDNAGTWVGADDFRSVSVDPTDRIVVHGTQLTTEPATGAARTDQDWVLVRLTADGADDATFGSGGKFTFDVLDGPANARSAKILGDGSILATGYSNTTAFSSVQPVIYKVTSAGALDTTWGTGGVFHEAVLLSVTEVYGIARQGDKWVTAAYGRDSTEQTNDWAPIRLNSDGTQDTSWGTAGVARIDFHGFRDNNREIAALPGDRVILVGHAQTANGVADGQIVVLEGDGEEDLDFSGDGRLAFDLGGTADDFWNAAVAPDQSIVVVVGLKGVGSTQTADLNDDAAIVVFPLE